MREILLLFYTLFCDRYIYFAANVHQNKDENHRMFVLENTNPDPFAGSFTFKGQITDSTDKWAIDGTAFEHPLSGRLYFIWSGWEGDVNAAQILYIAEMSNPWTIGSERVEIARPIFNWETNHRPNINEGPQVTIRGDTILLVYSASGSWTNDYCLGLITASLRSDPLKPSSWTKHPNPIFKSANNVFGPGHHSLTTSPDGTEDWIIYHSARFKGSGWTRQVRCQRFTWNADGTPNLGAPAPPNAPIPLPSGDPPRVRYEAQDCPVTHGVRCIHDGTASNQTKVGHIDLPESSVTFSIYCPHDGNYVIIIRNCNGTGNRATATHSLTINNGSPIQLSVVNSGWDQWGASMLRTRLKRGPNTLILKKGNHYAELDVLDLVLEQ